ncbi:MAG: bifunctional demethylmenaquinone methyltransferase/2-methoxy-6-polyprenyl-1,4-benzoquinol methylase UbiE [Cyanobacteria bacterium HKST-UBA05]|nr:bifunctional demethylmenaquinone methyltransferase/2-methoxy-6-polyprenyl-1,4-benzoquinol methylase UbiE [Cyanobacteria bacterium HKST-UBA05]
MAKRATKQKPAPEPDDTPNLTTTDMTDITDMTHATTTRPASLMTKSPAHISHMFDALADRYDDMNDWIWMGLHRLWKQDACHQTQADKGDWVLDVCTGTGDMAERLSTMVGPEGRVVALDFSAGMLEKGKQRLAGRKNISWRQGDALDIPFEDHTFQSAVISFGLRNVAHVPQALAEMARVVKPGGTVVILDTASDNPNPLGRLYMSAIMPFIGHLIGKNQDAYQYLNDSTQTFETPAELKIRLRDAGLDKPVVKRLGFGSVVLISAQKPL